MKHLRISHFRPTHQRGSALILTVVLTTLLALVGVLFALTSRLDRIAASATHQNRTLGMAVGSVVTLISEQLVQDVPGVAGAEGYDYPAVNDAWLASLEPMRDPMSPTAFYWGQISDLTGAFTETNQVRPALVAEHGVLDVDPATGELVAEPLADADGDGVGDAKWFRLPIAGARGQSLYAAVRVVDHGAMLNVNTALKFVPRSQSRDAEVDGSSEMQINIVALADSDPTDPMDKDDLDAKAAQWQRARSKTQVSPLKYEHDVGWNFGAVPEGFTPFGISDELKLRNRFVVNHVDIKSRLGNRWQGVFHTGPQTPLPTPTYKLAEWYDRVSGDSNNYDYRHICTTYNMDRVIDPNGVRRMVNVKWLALPEKEGKAEEIYRALLRGIRPGYTGRERVAAQLAVNLVDYLDQDNDTAMTQLTVGNEIYYGFEAQPFISGVAFAISPDEPEDPNQNRFSIELYNPYDIEVSLQNCRFEFLDENGGERYPVDLTTRADVIGAKEHLRISSDDRYPGPLPTSFSLARYSNGDAGPQLTDKYDIYLTRVVDSPDGNSVSVYLDAQITDANWFAWENVNGAGQFTYLREDPNDTEDDWRIVYQEMFDQTVYDPCSSGDRVNLNLPAFKFVEEYAGDEVIFPTIGEISRIPIIGPSPDRHGTMGAWMTQYRSSQADPYDRTIDEQKRVFLDLADRDVFGIFQHLTALNPARHRDITEDRLKGRVNINTAPFFVMQKLPWLESMSGQSAEQLGRPVEIAKGIVDFRNAQARGFKSIGELLQVPDMDVLRYDGIDNQVSSDPNDPNDAFGPDLTPDAVKDDLEERDLLFARISNLVTVRSDVFSAYVLVRFGAYGPQKRVLAILDRSQVDSADDRVKIVALHQVPDPR